MLTHLDLFSGIGGFSLGFEMTGQIKTVGFCEIDTFCQKILKQHWPDIPVHSDIKETDFEQYRGTIDIITGGYPCQPFSVAGRQKGEKDDRHLWPRLFEIITQVRPAWVVCENVYGHVKLGLDKVLTDLESQGYTTRPFVVPACSVNAPHRRDRVWIIAYSNRIGRDRSWPQQEQAGRNKLKDLRETVPNTESQRVQGLRPNREQVTHAHEEQKVFMCDSETGRFSHWETEPGICRVVDGLPDRVDRIKALGNTIVPQIAFNIALSILKY